MDCAFSGIEAVLRRGLTTTGTLLRAILPIAGAIGVREVSEDELLNEMMVLGILGSRSGLRCRHRF